MGNAIRRYYVLRRTASRGNLPRDYLWANLYRNALSTRKEEIMANCSDVDVLVMAHKCGEQIKNYIKELDKEATYNICTDTEGETHGDETTLRGFATGRWTYINNLESAFGDRERRKQWCNSNPEAMKAFAFLEEQLKYTPEAYVRIKFTEVETGMSFINKGFAMIRYNKEAKKVIMDIHNVDDELTPENMVKYKFVDDLEEANSYLGINED